MPLPRLSSAYVKLLSTVPCSAVVPEMRLEGNPSGVNIFKDLTHRLFGGGFVKLNDRKRVFDDRHQDLLVKLIQSRNDVLIVAVEFSISVFPCVGLSGIVNGVQRE